MCTHEYSSTLFDVLWILYYSHIAVEAGRRHWIDVCMDVCVFARVCVCVLGLATLLQLCCVVFQLTLNGEKEETGRLSENLWNMWRGLQKLTDF